jgi:hypothetical protein
MGGLRRLRFGQHQDLNAAGGVSLADDLLGGGLEVVGDGDGHAFLKWFCFIDGDIGPIARKSSVVYLATPGHGVGGIADVVSSGRNRPVLLGAGAGKGENQAGQSEAGEPKQLTHFGQKSPE